jgi:hypothetical protein
MRSGIFIFLSSLLVITGCGVAADTATPNPEHVVAFVFDWDDNIFNMPTQIMLYDKVNESQVGISTAEYAVERQQIGKSGKYVGYKEKAPPETGSLRFFGDFSEDRDARFFKDIEAAMKGTTWKGPVWNDFIAATSRESTAKHTWLITARLHAAATIHSALGKLKPVHFPPPLANIWPVSAPEFEARYEQTFGQKAPGGGASNPSARKAAVMEQMLDRIEKTPLPDSAPKVTGPDGRTTGRYHLWGFSDDDLGNFQKAVEVMQRGVDAARWPHIKITVFYTGTNRKEVQPHAVTLLPRAEPRPHTEGAAEWSQILSLRDGSLLRLCP